MIIKYITELLLEHECVIVPEFGAFISKETPATLDYVNHILTPPSKEVAFNGQLLTDDGLLIGYVAEKQGVSMTDAAKMVHDFSMRSLAVIEASGTIRLDGFGVLSRVNSRDYVFQLDDNMNLLGDAYGLTTLKAQPIYRRETYKQIAEQIATEQKKKNTLMTVHEEEKVVKPHRVNRYNYKWFRASAYSMLIAMVLVLLGWGADKSDSKLASWNPLFYSSPNEFVVKHLGGKMDANVAANFELFSPMELNLPLFKKEVNYIQPREIEVAKPETPVDPNGYYIIGASVKNDAAAQKCVKSFKKLGFEDAMALPMNDQGNVRVAYELVIGKDAALKRLEIIKKDYNEAAWLLRKK